MFLIVNTGALPDLTLETREGILSDNGITPKKFNSFSDATLYGENELKHNNFKVFQDKLESDLNR